MTDVLAPTPPRAPLRARLRAPLLLLAGGLAFGVFLAALARLVERGPLSATLLRSVPAGLLWAALAPAIAVWDGVAARVAARTVGAAALVVHLPAAAAAALLDTALRRALVTALGGPLATPFEATLLYFADLVVATYAGVVIGARALATRRALAGRVGRELRLRSEVARAKLAYLEAQLRPHFLFNALSTISELAHDAPARAAEMLRHLAALLRHALDGRRGEEIRLRDELEALEPYLAIQRIRFTDWLDIALDADPDALDALVPRLVLQPVVENAIRHGLRDRTEAGRIVIGASVDGACVRLRVADNGHGIRASRRAGDRAAGRGVGLSNVRARLDALYGAEGSLRLTEGDGGGAVTEIVLPLRRTPPAPAPPEVPNDDARPAAAAGGPPSAWRLGAAWAAWGLFLVQQSVAYTALRDRELRVGVMLAHDLGSAALWAALTPLVLLLARRAPVTRARWARSLGTHMAGAAAAAVVHAAAVDVVTPGAALDWSPDFWYLVRLDVVVYALLVGAAHLWALEARVRERDVAAARMRAELADARFLEATQELRPDVLLATLDELADEVARDPVAAERRLARLGEWLRLTLDGVGEPGVRVEPHAVTVPT